MRHVIGLAAVAIVAACGCNGSDDGPPVAPPQDEMAAILDAVKTAGTAVPTGDTLTYTRETLYDYIDGMAEEYLDAGFIRLAHSEWKAADAAGNAYVEVDLYDMGSAKGVAAVLPKLLPDQMVELAPGVRAHREAGMCEFGVGRYYVRLAARRNVEAQEPLVDALARVVAEAAGR